jgi:hypothetical protein
LCCHLCWLRLCQQQNLMPFAAAVAGVAACCPPAAVLLLPLALLLLLLWAPAVSAPAETLLLLLASATPPEDSAAAQPALETPAAAWSCLLLQGRQLSQQLLQGQGLPPGPALVGLLEPRPPSVQGQLF